jgi:mRNA-degrading endonuclease RelE of RelBE toxin-antitoxin system
VTAYTVEAHPRVRKALRQLNPATRKGILEAMRALGPDPRPDVDDTTHTVTVAVVGHRREVYRSLDL